MNFLLFINFLLLTSFIIGNNAHGDEVELGFVKTIKDINQQKLVAQPLVDCIVQSKADSKELLEECIKSEDMCGPHQKLKVFSSQI